VSCLGNIARPGRRSLLYEERRAFIFKQPIRLNDEFGVEPASSYNPDKAKPHPKYPELAE
jgi:hypothetical protein